MFSFLSMCAYDNEGQDKPLKKTNLSFHHCIKAFVTQKNSLLKTNQ